jgi:3-oxoacyl-[acyl-carrier-protein] synthase II
MERHMKSKSGPRRAVITGMGVVAPNGEDLDTFWSSIREGKSAGAAVTKIDSSETPGYVAAEIKGFDPKNFIDVKNIRRICLSTQYAIAAAKKAVSHSGINFKTVNRKRVGVVEGTSLSAMAGLIRGREEVRDRGYRGVSLFSVLNGYNGSGSSELARELGVRGHAMTLCSGSASGNDSIGYGLHMIRANEADIMIAGGAEAPIVDDIWAGFCKFGVMSFSQNPLNAMKPFDLTRDGFLLGEGAAFLVIEEMYHAMDRGAKIYAEVLGHGRSCEAYNPLAPHPKGVAVKEAIEKALDASGIECSHVDYINAHGTATASNDVAETNGIKALFGDMAQKLAISSTKPVTGHLLGAAGAVETVVCTLAINKKEVPPTINLSQPDPNCHLDYVSEGVRKKDLNIVLNINSGFGGKNSCLALGKFYEKRLELC